MIQKNNKFGNTLKLKKKIDDKLLKNKINLKGLKKKHTHYH